MNINQIKDSIKKVWAYKNVPFIEGQPGIGKTEAIYQLGKELNREVFYLHPNNHEPFEVNGLMYLGDSYTSSRKRTFYSESGLLPDHNFRGIILIDELPQACLSMQNALSRLIQERKAGSLTLHPEADIVITGNRIEDRAGANKTPTHIADRVCKLEAEFNIDTFIKYAREGNVHETIIAFSRYRPDIFNFQPNKKINCTPRGMCKAANHMEDRDFGIIAGFIGSEVTTELRVYSEVWAELPHFEDVIKEPLTIPVSERTDIRFSTLMMLVPRTTERNISTVLSHVHRFPIEEQVKFFKDLVLAGFNLSSSQELMAWWKDNKGLFE